MSQVTMRVIFVLFIITDVLVAVRSNLTLSTVLDFSDQRTTRLSKIRNILYIFDSRARKKLQTPYILFLVPDLHICNRYTWNVSQCVQHSIESMKPYLAAGVKVLNIPSFEPYYSSNFTFEEKKDFNGTWILKDLTIHGITNYTINNTKVSPRENSNHHEIKFHARFPLIRLFFTYDVKTNIRIFLNNYSYLMLTGHNIKVEFTELTANVTMKGFSFRGFYDNEIYLEVIWVGTEWNIGHTNIADFNENYNDIEDEVIKDTVTTSLQVFAKAASKVIKTDITNHIQNIANNIFLNFPVKISFPI